ncbi:MAG: ATP-binding protein [Lachnospiraceae bacterium]|nr:ATP-binding protein [Lachnospiraceae bacterium]
MIRYHMSQNPNVGLLLDIDSTIPAVLHGDDMRLRQILLSILGNAVKFTETGSIGLRLKWSIATDSKTGILKAEIEDTGCGICPEKMKQIFEPFSQARHYEHKHVAGSGVGLLICKQLLHMMQGELKAESELGKGSIFSFELPLKIVDVTPSAFKEGKIRSAEDDTVATVISFRMKDVHILVVDDNVLNLQVTDALLKRYDAGVTLVESGEQALMELEKESSYDLIFMDEMMPEMDGKETTRAIRNKEASYYKNVPIVALTANAISGAEERCIQTGMNAYLSKPVDLKKLDRILDQYIPEEKKNRNLAEIDAVAWEDDQTVEKEKFRKFLSELSLLNVQEGMEYCMNRPSIYISVIRLFSQTDLTDNIRNAYLAEDWKNYIIYVHSLKSSARNIGAAKLAEQAQRLETAGKNGNTGYVRRQTDSILRQYARLLEYLNTALLELPEDEKKMPQRKQFSQPEIQMKLMEMQEALESMNPVTIEQAVKSVREISWSADNERELEQKMMDLIEDLDYLEAAEVVEELKKNAI